MPRHLLAWFLLTPGFLASALALTAKAREEFPGLNEKWTYYQSPHFELYSQVGERRSRDALERMELMRGFALAQLRLVEKVPQPITLFFFDSDRDFHGYLPDDSRDDNLVSFYTKEHDRTVILLNPDRDDDLARSIVYSNYLGYLLLASETDPPAWYHTGVLQVFSQINFQRSSVEVGMPAESWIDEFRHGKRMPLSQVFGMSGNSATLHEERNLSIYSAECWALLHFFDFSSGPPAPEKLRHFVELATSPRYRSDPIALEAVCRTELGLDYAGLLERIESYVHRGDIRSVRLPAPEVAPAASYIRREPSHDEMADRLAELALRLRRSAAGKLELLKAVERSPDDARLREVLGNDALADNDTISAVNQWDHAVALGTSNPSVLHDLAQIKAQRWFESFDLYFRLPPAKAVELRELLERSIKAAPEEADGYEFLAWVESAAPKVEVRNVNLVQQHFAVLKNKGRTLLALALIRLRLDDLKGAEATLDSLDKVRHEDQEARVANTIRQEVTRRLADQAMAADSAEAAAPAAPAK